MGQTSSCSRCYKNKATIMIIYTSKDTVSSVSSPRKYIPECVTDYCVAGKFNYEKEGWNITYEMRTCFECLKDSDLSDLEGFRKKTFTSDNGFAAPGSLP